MKKAFTLIEVMVAVIIVFVIISVTMNIISNNKKLINLLMQNREFALKASVAFIENKDVKNNYERVIDFNLTNDKIIHILKKDKIRLDVSEDLKQEYNFSNFNFTEIVKKLKAYDKTNSAVIYSIGIQ